MMHAEASTADPVIERAPAIEPARAVEPVERPPLVEIQPAAERARPVEPAPSLPPAQRAAPALVQVDARAMLEGAGLQMVETARSGTAAIQSEEPAVQLGRARRERPRLVDEPLQQVETKD